MGLHGRRDRRRRPTPSDWWTYGQGCREGTNDTIMLIALRSGVVAPALIRPTTTPMAAWRPVATWNSGEACCSASPDCTTSAHATVCRTRSARGRAGSNAGGILLHGARQEWRPPWRFIDFYDTGAPGGGSAKRIVSGRDTINLTTAYPPPPVE
jgi:hypothetical protein